MSQWSASLLATRAGASWAQLDPKAHLGGSHLAEDPTSQAKKRGAVKVCGKDLPVIGCPRWRGGGPRPP